MKRIVVACVVLLVASQVTQALPKILPSSVCGGSRGLKAYIEHDFDAAIKSSKDGKDMLSRLVTALSYVERYNIYKEKTDKAQASMLIDLLEVDVAVEDAEHIEKVLQAEGNPNGNKEAAKLLKKSLENADSSPEHILMIAGFADPSKGIDAGKIAMSALGKRLKPVRDYVSKGGYMPEKMKELFKDKHLLEPLVAALASDKTDSYARKCLVIIEEPALALLDEQDLTKNISDTIVAIKKAIAKRKKKFAASTWFSATGK